MPIIQVVNVFEDVTVEIKWTCRDGSIYTKRYTIPPKNTREYKEEKEEIAQTE